VSPRRPPWLLRAPEEAVVGGEDSDGLQRPRLSQPRHSHATGETPSLLDRVTGQLLWILRRSTLPPDRVTGGAHRPGSKNDCAVSREHKGTVRTAAWMDMYQG
jgi:hypothetical protein